MKSQDSGSTIKFLSNAHNDAKDALAMLLDAFIAGDVYIDYPFEDAKFRYHKESGKVYRRFYGQAEMEIKPSSKLYNEAISVGVQITPEEYFRDPS